jgi:hypothetical protein
VVELAGRPAVAVTAALRALPPPTADSWPAVLAAPILKHCPPAWQAGPVGFSLLHSGAGAEPLRENCESHFHMFGMGQWQPCALNREP